MVIHSVPPTVRQAFNTATQPELLKLQGRQDRISFSGVTFRNFALKANINHLQMFCDNYLNFADDNGDHSGHYFKAAAPFVTLARFAWHVVSIVRGSGAAAEFKREGNSPLKLVSIVIRAHLSVASSLPTLLRKRREVKKNSRISEDEFRRLMRTHSIRAREVAAQ